MDANSCAGGNLFTRKFLERASAVLNDVAHHASLAADPASYQRTLAAGSDP